MLLRNCILNPLLSHVTTPLDKLHYSHVFHHHHMTLATSRFTSSAQTAAWHLSRYLWRSNYYCLDIWNSYRTELIILLTFFPPLIFPLLVNDTIINQFVQIRQLMTDSSNSWLILYVNDSAEYTSTQDTQLTSCSYCHCHQNGSLTVEGVCAKAGSSLQPFPLPSFLYCFRLSCFFIRLQAC